MGFLTNDCNSTGAWITGNVPHRGLGGAPLKKVGLNSSEMLSRKLSSYVLFNLEPELDFHDTTLLEKSLKESKCNIIFTNYLTPIIEKYADIIIPISTFAETKGSFINIEGKEQSFQNIVKCDKNIFEGWSILNQIIIANDLGSYEYDTIRASLAKSIDGIDLTSMDLSSHQLIKEYDDDNTIFLLTKRHIYQSDSIVKRSESLKMTKQSEFNTIFISENLQDQIHQSGVFVMNGFNMDNSSNKFVVNKKLSSNTIIFPSSDYAYKVPKSSNIEFQS